MALKHHIPLWTFWATPLVLALMLLIPWAAYAKTNPDAGVLILALIAIGNATVLISITHWIKGAKRHDST